MDVVCSNHDSALQLKAFQVFPWYYRDEKWQDHPEPFGNYRDKLCDKCFLMILIWIWSMLIAEVGSGVPPACLLHCSSITSFHLLSRPGAPLSFSKSIKLLDCTPQGRRRNVCLVELEKVSWGQWSFYWGLSGRTKNNPVDFFIVCFIVSLYSLRKGDPQSQMSVEK